MQIEYSLNEIKKISERLWENYAHKKVWAFHADMGAGKTTLIHAICNHLKITHAVNSPTFAIIKEYKSPFAKNIFHMDWYRLKDEEEAIQAGVEDVLHSGNYCFIEWPEKAAALLPLNTLHIYLEISGEKTRILSTEE